MVKVANQLAFINQNIRADTVDLTSFPFLAQRYDVAGVPKTIIEDTSFSGSLPAPAVYLEILKAVNPEISTN